MKRIARLILVLCIAGITLGLAPRLARAALDSTKAEADAHTLIQSSDYTFCTKPEHPLSGRARELCPLAGEIPGCSALVAECADDVPKPPDVSPFWEKVFAFLGRIAPYLAWTVVGVLVVFVLYLILKAIRATREDAIDLTAPSKGADVALLEDAAAPEPGTAADALLRLAAEARARGDARTALFTYLAAALRALDDRGAIRIARDRTNGEYLRACKEASARPPLREIVREVDGVQFGGAQATNDTVAMAADRAEAIVRGSSSIPRVATAALMALGVVLSLGACKGGPGAHHDDPAGRDLLVDLLTKQGAEMSSLPGSLADLPMNGASGPVVILDAERVPLEDETREHLVQWVKQGGFLVLAGDASRWPPAFWAKRAAPTCNGGLTRVTVETRDAVSVDEDDEDDDAPPKAPSAPHAFHAKVATNAAMTWPNENRAPRAIAHLESGDLYGALRTFGTGRILGLASADLLSNAGLSVPGNAEALVAMLTALDRSEFAIARSEQGVAPPNNPFAGLMRIGLGPALAHVAFFIPLLFLAYGLRQTAPRREAPPRRRAFAEHVQAVGALYARTRAASHALAAYTKHVDDRLRALAPRGMGSAQFLAARSGADLASTTEIYARALEAKSDEKPKGDELQTLLALSRLYARAVARK